MTNGNTYFLRNNDRSPRGRQDRGVGRRLIVVGWVLRVGGAALGLGSVFVAQACVRRLLEGTSHQGGWLLALLVCVPVFFLGWCGFALGRVWEQNGRRHTAEILDPLRAAHSTEHVLYLRPFDLDTVMSGMPMELSGGGASLTNVFFLSGRTLEEDLVRRFGRLGRVVAIGRPGEPLPEAGAERMYVADDEWQRVVSGLIARARVVTLSVGTGQGTVWEFVESLRVLPPERLVLLIYCDRTAYDAFREVVAERCALPEYPPPARPKRPRWEVLMNGGRKRLLWDFALKGVIVFGPDWQPRFVRFDPSTLRVPSVFSVRKLLRRELDPVLDRLAALPPRR
ncbi:hypothetical protein OG885_14590 [Streptomyces sp. NBC_00028]|uniref:hypothetical protein n=1 Tax=Streptomyces sp. NBC_00028 TaxID=2975624 RepID=UPI00324D4E1F